jgi:hypothetical protein
MFYKETLNNKTRLTYKCSVVDDAIIRFAAEKQQANKRIKQRTTKV